MDNFDMRKALPLLQSLGISPERLGPEKLEEILRLTSPISKPSDITPELAGKIMRILGVNVGAGRKTIKRTTKKIGRNEKCPCGSEKKYKKCCGQM